MKKTGGILRMLSKETFFYGSFILAAGMLVLSSGCETINAPSTASEKVTPPGEGVPADRGMKGALVDKDMQITKLQNRIDELKSQVQTLKTRAESEKVDREQLVKRLEAAHTAREDAIREVVRIRARIQGMASKAEASAMFAEARVILDRMEEEAYNAQSQEDLQLARSYMARGKGALEQGNPGGAAYLFDLITGLYEGIKKNDPRRIKVSVSAAAVREKPSKEARQVGILYLGDPAEGIDKGKEWIKIRTPGGVTGWILWSQIQ